MIGHTARGCAMVVALALAAQAPGLVSRAHAQETRPEPDPVLRLEAWLKHDADRNETARLAGSVLGLIMGATAIGAGIYVFIAEDSVEWQILGPLLVAEGAMLGGLSVVLFTMTTPPEDRWTRWRKVRAQGVSPEDVAGFTGELRADVELARFQRLTSAVIGFSMAGGGIAAGVLSLASDDEDARIIGLSLGIGLTVIGLATGFLSLAIRSPIEDDWSEMRRGNVPIEEAATGIELHVAPAIAKDGGGLGLTGTF